MKIYLMIFLLLLSSCGSLPKGPGIKVAYQNKVHQVSLEQYVMGVLSKEVPHTWPIEALKAQAVASRSYALYRREHPRSDKFDVQADTSDQVYEHGAKISSSIRQAVHETAGEILEYDGKTLEAFFHACCGGESEPADQIWKASYPTPLLTTHQDPYCSAAPPAHWDFSITREDMERRMKDFGKSLPDHWEISLAKDKVGRVTNVNFVAGKKIVSIAAPEFRKIVGYEKLKSTLFELSEEPSTQNDSIAFTGRGAGHGVGLCQWGAKGMADQGSDYREILKFYYPTANLVKEDKMIEELSTSPESLEKVLENSSQDTQDDQETEEHQ